MATLAHRCPHCCSDRHTNSNSYGNIMQSNTYTSTDSDANGDTL